MHTVSSRKIALITGASRGLGRHTALALAARGMDAILTYRDNAEQASAVVRDIQALGGQAAALALDVADSRQFAGFARQVAQTLRQHWQREQLDCLVNNAGIGIHASFADTSEAQFDQLMNIHLKGPFFLTQALLPLLADGGRILNISSGLTRFSQPGYAAYASMKGGVEVLTRYLARELGARGIRVNTLAPGAIETDFAGGLVRDNPHINAQLAAHTALGRVGLPEDIGAMAAVLLSDEAGWMTAQRVEASGGDVCVRVRWGRQVCPAGARPFAHGFAHPTD